MKLKVVSLKRSMKLTWPAKLPRKMKEVSNIKNQIQKRRHLHGPYRNKKDYTGILWIIICQKLLNWDVMDRFLGRHKVPKYLNNNK